MHYLVQITVPQFSFNKKAGGYRGLLGVSLAPRLLEIIFHFSRLGHFQFFICPVYHLPPDTPCNPLSHLIYVNDSKHRLLFRTLLYAPFRDLMT